MSDSVKFVFKTLIKVPIMIVICYAIFNLFAFSVSYVKMVGLSYVVMQCAIENNYIPPSDRSILEQYMADHMETGILENVSFTDNTTFTKQQYGDTVTVGVQAHYRFIFPLMPSEQVYGDLYTPLEGGGNFGGYKSGSQMDAERRAREENPQNNIVITYELPGLRYYPDLD